MNSRRRGPGEINAGSMADIAFLLLVFFLVTTTMDTDGGILRNLSPWIDDAQPPEIHERNVLVVKINMHGDMLVEGQESDLQQLFEATQSFMTNAEGNANHPYHRQINRTLCEERIARYQQALTNDPSDRHSKRLLNQWKYRLQTVDLIGAYSTVNDTAVISIQNDRGTRYSYFIGVQNAISASITELRDELCQKHFGISYHALDPRDPEEALMLNAAKQVYPLRISEAEPFQTQVVNQ